MLSNQLIEVVTKYTWLSFDLFRLSLFQFDCCGPFRKRMINYFSCQINCSRLKFFLEFCFIHQCKLVYTNWLFKNEIWDKIKFSLMFTHQTATSGRLWRAFIDLRDHAASCCQNIQI